MSHLEPAQEVRFLDLLKRRRELPLAEVVRLCADLPRLLDSGVGRSGSKTVKVATLWAVPLGPNADPEEWLRKAVTAWEPFQVRIQESISADPEQTVTASRPDAGHGATALARVLYELLGGTQQGIASRQFPPLPAINEAGNALLRRALSTKETVESGVDFWQRWLCACEVPMATGWRIPRWLLGIACHGDVLRLRAEMDATSIEFISRDRFRIGRSRSQSDFPTRAHHPDGTLDEKTTAQFSRVQVLGEWSGGMLQWRDGNGTRPSANGTAWQGNPLSWKEPTPFFSAGVLTLARNYQLQISPLPTLSPEPARQIENLQEWLGAGIEPIAPALGFGAVVLRPLHGQPLTRDSVWLGQEISIQLAKTRGFDWNFEPHGRPAARFLRLRGCFWLANSTMDPKSIRLNDAAMDPGQVAPLADGQDLEIGGRHFKVEVA